MIGVLSSGSLPISMIRRAGMSPRMPLLIPNPVGRHHPKRQTKPKAEARLLSLDRLEIYQSTTDQKAWYLEFSLSISVVFYVRLPEERRKYRMAVTYLQMSIAVELNIFSCRTPLYVANLLRPVPLATAVAVCGGMRCDVGT